MPARSARPGAPDPQGRAHQLEAEARAWAHRLQLPGLALRLTLRWHPRLRTTAGCARLGPSLILLNPRLLAFPEELTRTFLHELAHLVAHARHPRRRLPPHGPEWQQACCDLGVPGEKRCHTAPLAAPRRVAKKFLYHCPHCRREVARVRPFRRAEACLACCRAHANGRYDGRFRFVAGGSPNAPVARFQPELFRL
ncbi:MAG: SprT-like domain-containing protein [Chthoniobacterales bacterium]